MERKNEITTMTQDIMDAKILIFMITILRIKLERTLKQIMRSPAFRAILRVIYLIKYGR